MARRSLLSRLAEDERGAAAIEYGLWASMLFFSMLGAADFGLWRAYQLRLSSAVEQAGMLAVRAPNGLNPTALQTYVQTAAALPGTLPTVDVHCNNGVDATSCSNAVGRTNFCLSNAIPVTYTAAANSGAACAAPANTTAGYYMTIKATYAFHPLVLPKKWLSGKSISDTLVVRLE